MKFLTYAAAIAALGLSPMVSISVAAQPAASIETTEVGSTGYLTIVKFKPGVNVQDPVFLQALGRALDATVHLEREMAVGMVLLRLTPKAEQNYATVLQRLRQNPQVEFAETDGQVR